MQSPLLSRVRKSILKELVFTKSFSKFDLLDLVKSDFLEFAKFAWLTDFQYFYKYFHQ